MIEAIINETQWKRPCTSDPPVFQHAIRHLNGTGSTERNAFDYNTSFTSEDIQQQKNLTTELPKITPSSILHIRLDYQFISRLLNATLDKNCLLG